MIDVQGRTVKQIFGYPDYLKFRSCMTLFGHCAPQEEIFRAALQKYFDGEIDPSTVELLG